jgi:hypothetical protein
MNNKKQAIELSTKIDKLIDIKKGLLTLYFFDNTKLDVRFLSMNSRLDSKGIFTCTLDTFTNDIHDIKTYDIFDIKDIE